MLRFLGEVDNVVIQHEGVRAIHGWLDMKEDSRIFYFPSSAATFVFKIIYTYKRPDAEADHEHARGFLAETVYGVDEYVAGLVLPPMPEGGHGFVLWQNNAVAGVVRCSDRAGKALSLVHV